MRGALGLAAIIVVLAIFLPRVLQALEAFLLAFMEKATQVLQAGPLMMPMIMQ